jgi:hypothetical protein
VRDKKIKHVTRRWNIISVETEVERAVPTDTREEGIRNSIM